MLLRLLTAACVFGFGYYLGKEGGRTEPIREDMAKARKLMYRWKKQRTMTQ